MTKEIREVYGEALVKYGKDDPRVVVLDADVSGSTKSAIFKAACPERFFNVGIAEANMTAMAAGFAASGKIPFVNTFAVFLTSIGLIAARAFGSYSGLPIKMMGAYGGLSDAFDGPSHHSLEDVAIMRALPNFKVYVAGDAVQTDWLVKHAIDDPSPMYIRLSRNAFTDVYAPSETFEDGKAKVVREGWDAAVIACGAMVGNALEAAEILAKEGIELRVVDMFCIKPIDAETILDCAQHCGAIVTAEEHNIIGGLGSAVSEVLCKADAVVPTDFVGLGDLHAECGPYNRLIHKYAVDADAIAEKVRAIISKKKV
ncbi:MAG: transketolase C-terminal domain-containing protein [Christensenella sp.]|nr:transketolase C-terminal domain-containing protein [Christensenella sp.]